VFVSYSRKDRKWLDRLLVIFKPLQRSSSLTVWADVDIGVGALWRTELEKALDRALVAVLLVSADFLASDFIMDEEVPKLLRNAEERGTIIMPVILGPSLFEQSSIGIFQSINPVELPLSKLPTYQRDEFFVRLANTISDMFGRYQRAELAHLARWVW